ncbi:MAG: CHAT domain-containing protein [Isosphaeraceae bacterium]
MTELPQLEIHIRGNDTGDYTVDLQFRRANDDRTPLQRRARIDFEALDAEGDGYGRELTRQVFAEDQLRAYFKDAFDSAANEDHPLRVRLYIGEGASRLFGLKWELLEVPWADGAGGDATPGRPLSVHRRILFSRFMSSFDRRPVQLRHKYDLRALIAVANPENLAEYRMAPIDVDAEIAAARKGLGEIGAVAARGPETLNQIVSRLDGEEFDILYLVAHGALSKKGEPRLYLEDKDGRVAATDGEEFVIRLAELSNRPRLVVLASCQSAGAADDAAAGDEGAQAAIGPMLAAAGLPAILAMQARVSVETAARFMPAFFRELAGCGQVDKAAAVARAEVGDRPDFWVPVVITRIRDGRIWQVPGFASGQDEKFDSWKALFRHIEDNLKKDRCGCTPILGSGLLEKLVGSSRELALRWADEVDYAMSPQQREDLPQVTQYLSVMEGLSYPSNALEERLRGELGRRIGALDADPDATLDDLMASVRGSQKSEPHAILARLPFPVYVTTNADDQLRRALVEAGKAPRVELCQWHSRPECRWPASAFDDETYQPTLKEPLVYHLFGQLREPETMVVTEDDYFDYLIGSTKNSKLVPTVVKEALARSALLFLGFRLEEWDFRVLFRGLLAQGDRSKLSDRFTHVAAQIDPEEGRHIDPEKARRYLENYFKKAQISIYWGSVHDFVKDLESMCPPKLMAAPGGTVR